MLRTAPALLCAAALLLAGCTAASPDAEDPPVTTPATPPPVSPEPLVTDTSPRCVPLDFTPETAEEYVQRDTLDGCTDGVSRTEISNISEDVVWIIDGYHWRNPSLNPKIAFFRSNVASANGAALVTLEPGMSAELPPNVDVHLRLDPSVQSAWATYDILVSAASEKGVSLVDDALKKRRTTPALMYTCFRAGWETGKTLDKVRDDPDQQLRAAVFLDESADAREAGVNCAEQVSLLADDAKRRNEVPPLELPRIQAETEVGTTWSRRFAPFLKLAARKAATRGKG